MMAVSVNFILNIQGVSCSEEDGDVDGDGVNTEKQVGIYQHILGSAVQRYDFDCSST